MPTRWSCSPHTLVGCAENSLTHIKVIMPDIYHATDNSPMVHSCTGRCLRHNDCGSGAPTPPRISIKRTPMNYRSESSCMCRARTTSTEQTKRVDPSTRSVYGFKVQARRAFRNPNQLTRFVNNGGVCRIGRPGPNHWARKPLNEF